MGANKAVHLCPITRIYESALRVLRVQRTVFAAGRPYLLQDGSILGHIILRLYVKFAVLESKTMFGNLKHISMLQDNFVIPRRPVHFLQWYTAKTTHAICAARY